MEKWFLATKRADFDGWAKEFGISPITARIIRNRDLTDASDVKKFLFGGLTDCHSPWLLKDMEKAVDLLLEAINARESIRVIGDYDVDGICSSYILTRGLSLLGAKVDTAIPHRIYDGYGLNEHLIEEAQKDGVNMILTCDNGIAASAQIALANEKGIRVIVTDHHEVPFCMEQDAGGKEVRKEILPPALAIVDPKQDACHYPFPGICGGVVAYKLMQAMLEKTNDGALQDAMEELLEFAAFATVCDVMELKDENRIIVKEGLKRIAHSKNLGLAALMEVNGIVPDAVNAYHLGFVLGPCLNATGRLDTAKRALELLLSQSKGEAMVAAGELKDLNESRKNLTAKGVEEALDVIAKGDMEEDKVMVVFLPEVHESLAGIIAGRIREKFNHPVFLLTKGEEGVKGSGRSIEGYHMYEEMTKVSHFFTKFGGHAMAAGLSMREEDIDAFRGELNENCRLTAEDFVPKVRIDVALPLSAANDALAAELERLEPFGVGNPKPLFAQKELSFLREFRMGKQGQFARFRVRTPEGTPAELVYFGDADGFDLALEEKYGAGSSLRLKSGDGNFKVSVCYQLGRNTFRGNTTTQFVMQHYCF